LWVEAEIYETDIAKLQNVSNATVTSQTYPDEIIEARLVNIGNVVDDVTRTVKVIFEVKNKNKLLKVGMFANININVNANMVSEVLTVPKESIVDIGGKNVVFIHTKAQAFKGVEVLLGRTDGQYVEILNGLTSGARVVTTGNYQLRASVK
ncbi:MAG: efflux RND transporter periplasmic adaptor subunit, partial [Bacteroidota bacterium]|nr:efflux RND transporter periplasmic adaptor subunit [Bacteroidota bacterium]